jgi:hypothetical protein
MEVVTTVLSRSRGGAKVVTVDEENDIRRFFQVGGQLHYQRSEGARTIFAGTVRTPGWDENDDLSWKLTMTVEVKILAPGPRFCFPMMIEDYSLFQSTFLRQGRW